MIPAPWTSTSFYRWMASCIRIPGRPNFAFNGQPMDIWYVFVIIGLMSYAGLSGRNWVHLIVIPLQAIPVLDNRAMGRRQSKLERPAAAHSHSPAAR